MASPAIFRSQDFVWLQSRIVNLVEWPALTSQCGKCQAMMLWIMSSKRRTRTSRLNLIHAPFPSRATAHHCAILIFLPSGTLQEKNPIVLIFEELKADVAGCLERYTYGFVAWAMDPLNCICFRLVLRKGFASRKR